MCIAAQTQTLPPLGVQSSLVPSFIPYPVKSTTPAWLQAVLLHELAHTPPECVLSPFKNLWFSVPLYVHFWS